MESAKRELDAFVAVDVEASGPNPGRYSLLSIGAATIAEPRRTFYVELRPDSERFKPEAMAVNQLSLEELGEKGLQPEEALLLFEGWLEKEIPHTPIFVAFNAPFDWMFVCDYFHRYLNRNPFGYKAVDIKAYAMGLRGSTWTETSHGELSARFLEARPLSHHALQDAIDEAEMFANMLAEAAERREAK